MSLKSQVSLLVRAATFATLAIGGLSIGLTITTYTVAKANDLMFAQSAPVVAPVASKAACS